MRYRRTAGTFSRSIMCCGILLLVAVTANDTKAERLVIAFFAVIDGEYLDYGESSFSVPRPLVIIDPVVLGSSRNYPNNTTVEQIGPDRLVVRITGRVYDFLADMVADHHADIREVTFTSSVYGHLAPLPLQPTGDGRSHPWFDESSLDRNHAMRPYAFQGRFDLGEQELQIHTGYNGINVSATNMNEGTGTATLNIKATVNRKEGKYDIEVDVRNSMDAELYNPVLVYINDPEVNPDNVDFAYALLNGKRVGLRFVGDQLQLDRPVIGVSRATPRDNVPNVVNVTGDPDRFVVRYKDHESELTWSYTSR